jgi:hypothetical protein
MDSIQRVAYDLIKYQANLPNLKLSQNITMLTLNRTPQEYIIIHMHEVLAKKRWRVAGDINKLGGCLHDFGLPELK